MILYIDAEQGSQIQDYATLPDYWRPQIYLVSIVQHLGLGWYQVVYRSVGVRDKVY